VLIFVEDAATLIAHLTPLGIGVRTIFMPMHSQPCYGVEQAFPNTEKLYATGVCLPSAPSLTEGNITYICDAIRHFYTRKAQ
jgi:dTDP-4-amino-4,6-dideoxygalactose transaminase